MRFVSRLELGRCDDGDGTEFPDDMEHRLVEVVGECCETFSNDKSTAERTRMNVCIAQ